MVKTLERSFLYFPDKLFLATPKAIGLDYQDVFFDTASGRKLHGWFIPHPKATASLLFFHGNAGNISHRLEKIKIFHELSLATFIIDYAGYGKSEGEPSEANLYEDGAAAYRHAVEQLKIDPKQLFLYGESLGCAVVLELVQQYPAAGVILEGAFTSLKALTKRHMPFLAPFSGEAYNNAAKIEQVKVPKLFVHAKEDEICPFEQALQLYETAPPPKEKVWLELGGHNDAFVLNPIDYQNALKNFTGAQATF